MKRLAVALTAMMIFGVSLASTNQIGYRVYGKEVTIESPVQTATKKEQVRAKPPRIAKPKIFRSNPYRAAYYAANVNDNDDIGIDDESKITGYRKRDFSKLKTDPTPEDPEGIFTEEIQWKLFLARTAAMIRYHQIHS